MQGHWSELFEPRMGSGGPTHPRRRQLWRGRSTAGRSPRTALVPTDRWDARHDQHCSLEIPACRRSTDLREPAGRHLCVWCARHNRLRLRAPRGSGWRRGVGGTRDPQTSSGDSDGHAARLQDRNHNECLARPPPPESPNLNHASGDGPRPAGPAPGGWPEAESLGIPHAMVAISRCSHACAMAQSRLTVRGEMPSAVAVSSIVSPPKNRHSTTLL